MNSYFERLDLEMVALESAIGAYEAENDITDEYLHDYSEPAPAYESASDDDFGFGLFDDMYATPATEEADSGKGSKIGNGIKNILGAIKSFFIKCKDGIVNFFQSFKKKKTEVNAEAVKENASPTALQLATSLRGALKQTYTIIGHVTTQDSAYIAKICSKIDAVLSTVVSGKGNNKVTAADAAYAAHVNSKLREENSDIDSEAMKEIGQKFRESGGFGSDSHTQGAKAEKALSDAEDILNRVEATEKDLHDAITNLKAIFNKEYTAAAAKLKKADDVAEDKYYSDDATEYDRERDADMKAEADKAKAKADKAELKQFNADVKKNAAIRGGGKAKDNKGISMQQLKNQVKQIVFVDYDFKDVQQAVDAVVKACGNNAAVCERLASKAPADVSGDAKIAYQMCKVLSRASAIYSKISNAITQLASGSVFDIYDGDNNKVTNTSRRDNWRPSAKNKANASDRQMQYVND